ncbi:MAG TPA: 6,7-dimethyl-8-ribityllumazine synthase [Bacteroidia bacterium]|jgi:6,7-dimethyl-8-ribityllumazine synthase|nr:6,7-dimethyl-8-ribityllumazine synthase [Bacteroidia bacterium]
MASTEKNLSVVEGSDVPNGAGMRIAIVVSEWNAAITGALFDGAVKTLLQHDVKKDDIIISKVPGSYELTLASQFLCEDKSIEAVIALGCVIQGETKHFDFICDAVAHGITNVGLKYNKPVIFGVLTTNNLQQAQDRAGGKHGNKGDEAAITALKMIALKRSV